MLASDEVRGAILRRLQKPGTSVDCAEEDKGLKSKTNLLNLLHWLERNFYLIPPDALRFDAEYYADSSEDTNDADCLKRKSP